MNLPAFSKTYDGVKVLDFPGLALKPGKIYAILGANGSGKSTFARIAAGILPADQKCRICSASISSAALAASLPFRRRFCPVDMRKA